MQSSSESIQEQSNRTPSKAPSYKLSNRPKEAIGQLTEAINTSPTPYIPKYTLQSACLSSKLNKFMPGVAKSDVGSVAKIDSPVHPPVEFETPANIFYKECPKHKYRILDTVCLDTRCQHKTIICTSCRDQRHGGHKIIHLRQFLEKMQISAHGVPKNMYTEGSLQCIQQLRKNFYEELDNLKATFERTIGEVQTKTKDELDSAEALFSRSNDHDYRTKLSQFRYDHADHHLESSITQVIDAYLFLQEQPKMLQEALQNAKILNMKRIEFLKNMVSFCGDISKGYSKVYAREENHKERKEKEIKKEPERDRPKEKSKSRPTQYAHPSAQTGPIAWSPTLKHPDIQINDRIIRRVAQSTDHFVGIFGNRIFNTAPPFVHILAIKINAMTKDINIGVCEESFVIAKGFIDDDQISVPESKNLSALKSAKDSSERHRKSKKSHSRQVDFTRGDIVRLSYNTIDNVVTYTKIRGDTRETHSVACEEVEKGMNLRPYVSLLSVGDSVEILQ